jgi:CTP:molybdopterin cytidylyltransferase MocA
MRVAVIIPAAGSSRRYSEGAGEGGFARSKLDEDLGGRPVLQRTVELFTKHDAVSAIIVAGPADPAAQRDFRDSAPAARRTGTRPSPPPWPPSRTTRPTSPSTTPRGRAPRSS